VRLRTSRGNANSFSRCGDEQLFIGLATVKSICFSALGDFRPRRKQPLIQFDVSIWTPLIGVILATIDFFYRREYGNWMRKMSICGLVLSSLSTLFGIAGLFVSK
jgi:hypothetical protein